MGECAVCDVLLQNYAKLATEGKAKEKRRLLRMQRQHEKAAHGAVSFFPSSPTGSGIPIRSTFPTLMSLLGRS
jgi:hypothetical protein